MRRLTKQQQEEVLRRLSSFFHSISPGWLANQFRGKYYKEVYLDGDNVDIVMELLSLLKTNRFLVFHEHGLPQSINGAICFNTSEKDMTQFRDWLDNQVGTNVYVIDASLRLYWIITLCHEGDIHVALDRKSYKQVSSYLRDQANGKPDHKGSRN